MRTVPFSLYDAFSENSFGGSQGAVIYDATKFTPELRLQIARELGYPATCFIEGVIGNSATARFQSTQREYLMCGHGTICLMSSLVEIDAFEWDGVGTISIDLHLPTTTATVEISHNKDDRILVMLDIALPTFSPNTSGTAELTNLLGLSSKELHTGLPLEIAIGDFTHLVVPVGKLSAMKKISPDFDGLRSFCKRNNIETVATFSMEVENPLNTIHVRDFCPAVGVAESAAAGTTNAALTAYLIRHSLVQPGNNGQISVNAEQGLEINRPSKIQSIAHMNNGAISRLQVGGVATKVLDGNMYLSD